MCLPWAAAETIGAAAATPRNERRDMEFCVLMVGKISRSAGPRQVLAGTCGFSAVGRKSRRSSTNGAAALRYDSTRAGSLIAQHFGRREPAGAARRINRRQKAD